MIRALLASLGLIAAVLGGLAATVIAAAQTPPAGGPSAFRPGIADLMTMTIQPRHIKLWLAGREKNWPYAKYELDELQESFERVVLAWPKYKGLPMGGIVDAVTKGPMAAVSQAIADSSAERFAAAYAQLTDGCNACHQAANLGMIVIKVPDASSFPDQDFRPLKP